MRKLICVVMGIFCHIFSIQYLFKIYGIYLDMTLRIDVFLRLLRRMPPSPTSCKNDVGLRFIKN